MSIIAILTYIGNFLFFYFFLPPAAAYLSISYFLNILIILYAHISKSQLIPIAAQTHAAGANTNSKRIMTEAK